MIANAPVVLPLVGLSAVALYRLLNNGIPMLVGGAVLCASAVAAGIHGAWLAMTGSDSLDEAKEQLSEAIEKKAPRPYDGQTKEHHIPGKRTVLVDLDNGSDEDFETVLDAIRNAES